MKLGYPEYGFFDQSEVWKQWFLVYAIEVVRKKILKEPKLEIE